MKQTEAIHAALKRIMRSSGRNYAQAARVLKLSEASVKRLLSRSELSLERLELLCDWLGCRNRGRRCSRAPRKRRWSRSSIPARRRNCCSDSALLLTAFLTLNRWSEAEILEIFKFRKPELDAEAAAARAPRPDRAHAVGPHKDPRRAQFRLAQGRTIQKYFATRVLPEFLATRFEAPGEQMHFVGGMLSRPRCTRCTNSWRGSRASSTTLVKQDLHLPIRERYGVSLFMGLRPWEFSEFTRLRRKPREKFF